MNLKQEEIIMDHLKKVPILDPNFVGRTHELKWLEDHVFTGSSSHRATIVTGSPGIGKTSLVRQFLSTQPFSFFLPLMLDLNSGGNPFNLLDNFIENLYKNKPKEKFLVVIDGAESITNEKINSAISKIYNIKATLGLIFITRNSPKTEKADYLRLNPFSIEETLALLKNKLKGDITPEVLEMIVSSSQGSPLLLSIVTSLLINGDENTLKNILSGKIYDLSNKFELPETEIITTLKPSIISANDLIIEELKKQPESVFTLEPRKFEEILAELLTDMGWDIELTKATRDGGKDILAYLDTDLGRILCLVEAKRYRKDRTVGVDLVRNLYGTLCDHQANSAMLITTSSFSPDARKFQQRHEYQLRLRDYGDILHWINNYKI